MLRPSTTASGPTAFSALAAGAACLMVLSACSPASDGDSAESGPEEPERVSADPEAVVTRAANHWTLPDVQAGMSLHRVDDEYMIAQMTLTNEGDEQLPANMEPLSALLSDEYQGADSEIFNGVGWLDPGGRILHKPFLDDDNACLCSDTGGARLLSPEGRDGDTWTGYAVMQAPPDDTGELTVVTRVAPPFVDVPVQQGAPEGLDYTMPEELPGAEPQPAELESVIDSEDETVIENNATTDINLSTDVLFDVEESELTSEADALIEDAAEQIDGSGAAEVAVEGHADSTGNDAINDPLSQDRADAVRDRLEELVDADVDFTTEGYGSEQPIAGNDDEEGRALNRRVTISVPKDAAAEHGAAQENEGGQGEGIPADEAGFTGPADDDNPDAEAEVNLTGLRAVTGSTAVLTYEVTNPNDEDFMVGLDMGESWMEFRSHSAHGVRLKDGSATSHPLRVESLDGDNRPTCLCTSTSGSDLSALIVKPGRTHEYYVFLPITPGSTTTDIAFGEIGTAEDVAIQ